MAGIDPFASITGAVLDLLMRDGDLFLTLGTNLFRGVAIILIAWFGIRAALASADPGTAAVWSALMVAEILVVTTVGFVGLARQLRNGVVSVGTREAVGRPRPKPRAPIEAALGERAFALTSLGFTLKKQYTPRP